MPEKILKPICPKCASTEHRQAKLDWLNIEVDVCLNCFHIWPLPVKDERQAHTKDRRQAKPL